MTHIKITTSSLIALIHEIAGLAVGLGVLNSNTQGIVIAAAVSAVNAGALIANAIHHLADSRSVDLAEVEKRAITAATSAVGKIDFNGLVAQAEQSRSLAELEKFAEAKVREALQRAINPTTSTASVS